MCPLCYHGRSVPSGHRLSRQKGTPEGSVQAPQPEHEIVTILNVADRVTVQPNADPRQDGLYAEAAATFGAALERLARRMSPTLTAGSTSSRRFTERLLMQIIVDEGATRNAEAGSRLRN
jgi:hypothetical protein